MFLRVAALLLLLVPVRGQTERRHLPDSLGGSTIQQAALQMRNRPARAVVAWVRHQPNVRSAKLGQDGRTVDIRFADGTEGAILPSAPPVKKSVRSARTSAIRPRFQGGEATRAIVLEPFASELYLGPDAGDPETAALRSAGFSVDEAYDGAVSIGLMDTLSRYSVVYMLTHSGVNAQGEGVIATGQEAATDPAVKPLLDDHTVIVVGIAGSDTRYYGVLSGYFVHHSGEFPANSLFFVNGCSMLRGTLVWQALASRGVRAMVSWDNEAMNTDDSVAAQDFFQDLASGRTVEGAVRDVLRSGHGQSVVNGVVGRIGYLGDGGFTLEDVVNPTPPTVVPSATPTETLPPPPTLPRPTATRVSAVRATWPTPLPWRTAIHLIPHS